MIENLNEIEKLKNEYDP